MSITPEIQAADELRFNGLVGLSSDYIFRGRSLTGGEPALQAGVGFEHDSGWFGGVWGSRVDFTDYRDHEVEIDYVLGWGRDLPRGWWAEISLRRYTYPRSSDDALDYDYTEVAGAVRYQDLVALNLSYAPSWTGYTLGGPVDAERLVSADLGVQVPLGHGFSAVAGLGRLDLGGPAGGAHWYWSSGIAYQYRRLTLEVGFYGSDSEAVELYGSTAAQDAFVGTVSWEF